LDLAGQRNGGFILSSAFLDKFWPVGGLMSHSRIATGGLNSIGQPHQIVQTYNNQTLGGWALAESVGGWKSGFVLWPKNSTKVQCLGGGLAIAKLCPASLFQ
jgi:hypothetical protein